MGCDSVGTQMGLCSGTRGAVGEGAMVAAWCSGHAGGWEGADAQHMGRRRAGQDLGGERAIPNGYPSLGRCGVVWCVGVRHERLGAGRVYPLVGNALDGVLQLLRLTAGFPRLQPGGRGCGGVCWRLPSSAMLSDRRASVRFHRTTRKVTHGSVIDSKQQHAIVPDALG